MITPLRGGVSNRTVLVERPAGEAWVVKQALAKLRVAVEWFSSPERIHREAAGMRALAALLPPGTVPRLLFEDHDQHLLGMEAVPRPHANWKEMLLAGEIERDAVEAFGRILGTIHGRSAQQGEELAHTFRDRSFFETLRLEPYYHYTAAQHPAIRPFFDRLIAETQAQHLALVHGDYSPKNILVQGERLVLLDHEVIHFGDPAFDVGFSLTHLLSKARHVQARRRDFLEAAQRYWQVYRQTAGGVAGVDGYEERAVRHTLACLLARVDGRSPLEYLTEGERAGQRRLVRALVAAPPATIPDLIRSYGKGLESRAHD